MIKLSIQDMSGKLDEQELSGQIEKNSGALETVRAGEARYADTLGWKDVMHWASPRMLDSLVQKADEVRKNADVFVLIGVGGSNQAARAVMKVMPDVQGPEIIYMGNTLSPYDVNKALEQIRGKSLYINVIAKNFETLEPGVTFRLLRTYLEEVYGEKACERIIATGTPGSHLHEIATQNGYAFLIFPPDTGARFGTMSDVGLFPPAVAGVDIRSLAAGALDMQKELEQAPPKENLAHRYACMRNLLHQKGYTLEMLTFFEPRLRYFSKWWMQLFAESEGKDGKGLFPVSSECTEDLHWVGQFVQCGSPLLFETFLTVDDPQAEVPIPHSSIDDGFGYLDGKTFSLLNKAAEDATLRAHSERLPCIKLSIPVINEYYLGQLFYFFQYSCYISATILGVNPFDQPGVEAYKAAMFRNLGK